MSSSPPLPFASLPQIEPRNQQATVDPPPVTLVAMTKTKIVSFTEQRLKILVKEAFFPKVGRCGQIYLSVDNAKQKKVGFTEDKTRLRIATHFSAYPLYKLPNPGIRAIAIKGKNHWTAETIAAAAALFYVPAQTEVVVVFPDLFDRQELSQYSQFRTKEGGVLTPCPVCKSNANVQFSSWSVQKASRRPRMSVGNDANMRPLVGPIYACTNDACLQKASTALAPSTLQGDESGSDDGGRARKRQKPSQRQFLVWTKDYFAAYPSNVRARYMKYLCGVGDIEDSTTFASSDLAASILDDRNSFADIAARLEMSYEIGEADAEGDYANFICTHGKPKPNRSSVDNIFAPMREAAACIRSGNLST